MNTNELGTKLYEGDVKELFIKASTKLYNSVVHTLGPGGFNSAIPTSNQYLSIINDGKTILETLSSGDIAEKLAINTLKESAFATNKNAGDGTTTTIIMQHELLYNIQNYNINNEEQITATYLTGLRDKLLGELKSYKKDIESDEDLKKIITVSLGSDKFTDIVFNAFNNLSLSQKPTLVKVNTKSTTDYVEIDGVNLAPVEVNPVVLKSISLSGDEPLNVLILNQEVSRIDNSFAALLTKISKSSKKTILLYTDIKPSVMDQLLYNIQEGALNLIPIRLAMPITQIDEIISDLEEYFGCKALSDMLPYQTNVATNTDIWGQGIGYILNKDSVIVKNDNEEYNNKEHLVPSHSSAIEIGFITFSQQDEDYRRLEDAVQSAYNARNYGYLLGAGLTYYSLSALLDNTEEKNKPIISALQSIFNRLLPADIESGEFVTYINDNIFDSYKVIEQVILNSFTVVAQILSTNCVLVPYQRNRINGNIE